ncbi:hypothetical protein F4777DRAFT_423486 [Nemania sp. FL0916]|nr:hypothetical protein F4777DRAFT_423486 [Nemania sp. FL0916]
MANLHGQDIGHVSSLYVPHISCYARPTKAIEEIFKKARQVAPCTVFFEGLGAHLNGGVSKSVREVFLQECNKRSDNCGIYIIVSTNRLSQLGPLLSHDSFFLDKFRFESPDYERRVKFCEGWCNRLASNDRYHGLHKHQCKHIAAASPPGLSYADMVGVFIATTLSIKKRITELTESWAGPGPVLTDNPNRDSFIRDTLGVFIVVDTVLEYAWLISKGEGHVVRSIIAAA